MSEHIFSDEHCDACGVHELHAHATPCQPVVVSTRPHPTPTVAKIAAEVAADLPDYIQMDGPCCTGYRTADAQEMIERAFAPLEPKPVNADVKQIAREAAQRIWEFLDAVGYKLHESRRVEFASLITAALAPLQAENQRARELLKEADRDITQRTKLQLRTDQEMERLQAELEQLREAHRAQQKNYLDLCAAIMGEGTFVECDIFEVAREHREAAARLATAEAALNELFTQDAPPAILEICRRGLGIDKAKGGALP